MCPILLVTKGPRVGLNSVPEPWKSKPWRFLVKGWTLDVRCPGWQMARLSHDAGSVLTGR